MKKYIISLLLTGLIFSGCRPDPTQEFYQNTDHSEPPTTEEINQYQKTNSFNTDEYIWEQFKNNK